MSDWYQVEFTASARVLVLAQSPEAAQELAWDCFSIGDFVSTSHEATLVKKDDVEEAQKYADLVIEP